MPEESKSSCVCLMKEREEERTEKSRKRRRGAAKVFVEAACLLTGGRSTKPRLARIRQTGLDQPIGSQAAARALLSLCSSADHLLPTTEQADGQRAACSWWDVVPFMNDRTCRVDVFMHVHVPRTYMQRRSLSVLICARVKWSSSTNHMSGRHREQWP